MSMIFDGDTLDGADDTDAGADDTDAGDNHGGFRMSILKLLGTGPKNTVKIDILTITRKNTAF